MIAGYVIAAVFEILGCWLFVQGRYILSLLSLAAFALALSLVPGVPARSYVVYGGVYIVTSVVFARATGVEFSITDWAGVGLLLAGVVLLLPKNL